jgi:hypothetical protein
MIELGTRVKDSITGFSGVATARTEYLYGCVRVAVEPTELKDGKPIESVWFDEQRLAKDSPAQSGGPGIVAPNRDPRMP